MNCPYCKSANAANAKFCTNCGAALEPQQDQSDISRHSVVWNENNNTTPNPPPKPSKKKKIWLIIILVIVGIAIIGGLTGAFDEDENKKEKTETSESSQSSKSASSSDEKQESNNENETSVETSKEISLDSSEKNSDISKVIYNKNGIKITYTGVEKSALFTEIRLLFENSNNEKYTVNLDDVSIDGYTYSCLMYTPIAANKKATDSISILNSYLEDNNTSYKSIKTVEAKLEIMNESYHTIDDSITFTLQ